MHWFLAQDPHAKSTTAFIQPYLTLAGLLSREASQLDFEVGFAHLMSQSVDADVLARKQTLICRPLKLVSANPHLLIGWIAKTRHQWSLNNNALVWHDNPFEVLADLYHYLNMDARADVAAMDVIWDHDQLILEQGLEFYEHLSVLIGERGWNEWQALLAAPNVPAELADADWPEIQAAHRGFQMGLELLGLLVKTSIHAGFDELTVNADLSVSIPERLRDATRTEEARKILVPPPKASANEIVAVSGGMFYAQETPGSPAFLQVGTHFSVGEPLYIIEVMKMFNKVYAEFSGTVTEVLVDQGDGVIVKKGQPLYRIEPDEAAEMTDPEAIREARAIHTLNALENL